eukprot:3743383-Rhodomonas_salina.4
MLSTHTKELPEDLASAMGHVEKRSGTDGNLGEGGAEGVGELEEDLVHDEHGFLPHVRAVACTSPAAEHSQHAVSAAAHVGHLATASLRAAWRAGEHDCLAGEGKGAHCS